jgi:hypothetical protein
MPAPDRVTDKWVNAVVTFTVPLDDVTVESDRYEKQAAVGRVIERLIDALPDDLAQHIATGGWEDMSDDA